MEALEFMLPQTDGAISNADLCTLAGTDESTLSKKVNQDLLKAARKRFNEYRGHQFAVSVRIRHRLAASMTAEHDLKEREEKIRSPEDQLRDARQTTNLLMKFLEHASFDDTIKFISITSKNIILSK